MGMRIFHRPSSAVRISVSLVVVLVPILVACVSVLPIKYTIAVVMCVLGIYVASFCRLYGIPWRSLFIQLGFILLFTRSILRFGNSVSVNLVLGNLFLVPFFLVSATTIPRRRLERYIPLSMGLFLFFCVASAALTVMFSGHGSLRYQVGGIYYAVNYIVFFAIGVYSQLRSTDGSRLVNINVKFWAALSSSVAILEQVFRTTYIGYLQRTNPLGIVPGTIITDFRGHVFYRSIGLFGDPNYLGSFMVLFLLYVLIFEKRKQSKIVLALLALIGLICSDSRSSIIALVVVGGFYVFNKSRNKKGALAVLMFLPILVYSGWPTISHVLALHNGSAQYHIYTLYTGFNDMMSHVFGVGIGNTGLARNSSWGASSQQVIVGSETGYLQVGDQLGVAGLLIFIWTLVHIYRKLGSISSRDPSVKIAMYGLLTLAILYVFLPVNNQVETLFMTWFIAGRAIVRGKMGDSHADRVLL